METPSFLVNFFTIILLCSFIFFVRNDSQQPDGSCNFTIQTQFLCEMFKIGLLICANTYEKYIVSKDYCNANHDDKMCFLLSCCYQMLLLVDIEGLLQKLEAFCSSYQHVECLYRLSK